MKNLKKIDIFGEKFNFSIFGNNQYNTNFGGLLTIFFLAFSISVTFLFGTDLYLRKNPKVLLDRIVPKDYHYINCSVSDLPYFWNIIDYENHVRNFTNILYPISTLQVYKYNTKNHSLDFQKKITIPNTKCTKEMVNNDDIFNKLGLVDFYCIDWKNLDYPLGGFWDATDSLYYIDQIFYFCLDGERSSNCTNISNLKDFFGKKNNIYYNYYYPSMYFSASDYDQPLQREYVNKFEIMSANLYKKKRLFFANSEINSNKGWIFDSISNSNLITYDNSESDIDYHSDNDLNNVNLTSAVYTTAIYLMKNHYLYSLSYMKVQDLAAQVGGFMKILLILFSILNFYNNKFNRDLDIMNKIFEFKKLDDETNKVDKNKREALKDFIKNSNTSKPILKLVIEIKNIRKDIRRKKITNLDTENEVNKIESALIKMPDKKEYEKSNELEIDIKGYFKYTCNLCFIGNESELFDIFDFGRILLTRKLDLTEYLKMIDQLHGLKNIVLKLYQIFLVDNQKKINLFSHKERLQIDIHENDDLFRENEIVMSLILKIIKKIKENSLEKIDKKLLENLDFFYKKFIYDYDK